MDRKKNFYRDLSIIDERNKKIQKKKFDQSSLKDKNYGRQQKKPFFNLEKFKLEQENKEILKKFSKIYEAKKIQEFNHLIYNNWSNIFLKNEQKYFFYKLHALSLFIRISKNIDDSITHKIINFQKEFLKNPFNFLDKNNSENNIYDYHDIFGYDFAPWDKNNLVLEEEEFKIQKSKKENYSSFIINHEKIYFPHKPYPFQENAMKKIIQALDENKKTFIFESPTGTGKTQSLLTSILYKINKENKKIDIENGLINNQNDLIELQNKKYQKNLKKLEIIKKSKLLYFTRSISQMNQVLDSANKCYYGKIGVNLTSRRRYCLNRKILKIKKDKDLNEACNKMRDNYLKKKDNDINIQQFVITEINK